MTKPRILVTRKLPETVEVRLARHFDAQFNLSDRPVSAASLYAAMREFDALVPTVSDKLNEGILTTPERRVQMIANVGVGFNNIDIETARKEGIAVSNTPDVLTDATADIAMLLILSVTRRAYAAERKLRDKRWSGFFDRRGSWHIGTREDFRHYRYGADRASHSAAGCARVWHENHLLQPLTD